MLDVGSFGRWEEGLFVVGENKPTCELVRLNVLLLSTRRNESLFDCEEHWDNTESRLLRREPTVTPLAARLAGGTSLSSVNLLNRN